MEPHEHSACNQPGCCGSASRREFLRVAGSGVVALTLGESGRRQPPSSQPATRIAGNLIPADKNLPADWVASLTRRGAPAAVTGKALETVGMPVGGVAAGQVYLLGDGRLGCWQVFNGNYFTGWGAGLYDRRTAASPLDQGFELLIESPAPERAIRLDATGFSNIEFSGEYPTGRVQYADPGCPLRVTLEAFSPFIPLNAADSALPATCVEITLANTSGQAVRAALAARLENAVCIDSRYEAAGLRRTRCRVEKGCAIMVHSAEADPGEATRPRRAPVVIADFEGDDYGDWKAVGKAFGAAPARGAFPRQQPVSGFQGRGLVNSYNDDDDLLGTLTSPEFPITRRYLNMLIGGGGHAGKTCVNLLIAGTVVRTAAGRNNEKLEWRTWHVGELEGQKATLQIVDQQAGPWGHINADQFELADEPRAAMAALDKLPDFGTMALLLADPRGAALSADALAGPATSSGRGPFESDAALPLASRQPAGFRGPFVTLAPGERRTFLAVLSWHFPNSANGHFYATRHADARDVAQYIHDNRDRLRGQTRAWRDAWYDSTLPRWLLDRIGATLSTLATGTCLWWKNGRFWAWEGVGCCEGTCAHVWNYAQSMAAVFPELERSVREKQDLGAALHPSGLVGFRGQQNNAYAADGQAGTVLKCYREHLMSVDESFLKRNWPAIRRVIEFMLAQDRDDDGLIENSQHNTFDINFEGPNTFVGALYLAALRAGEEMSRDMGDADFAARLRSIFDSGRERSVRLLWNGEYFTQRVDLRAYPQHQYGDGCLSDQLFGQCWAHHLGLGYLYPPELVQTAMRSIWKYNWAPDVGPYNAVYRPERYFANRGEAGLLVCTWPRSRHLDQGVLYRDEVWTGSEYQVATHMIHEGMLTEGLAIVRAIHDRYEAAKRNPYNEIECGDHYARALSSWGVLTALSGYTCHGPRGRLGFAPRITPQEFRCAFTAPQGWGVFEQKRADAAQTNTLDVRYGMVRLGTLDLQTPRPVRRATAALGEQAIDVKASALPDRRPAQPGENAVRLTFAPVVVEAGKPLRVTLSAV